MDHLKSAQVVVTDPKVSLVADDTSWKLLTGRSDPITEYSPGTELKWPARHSRHWRSEPNLSETYIPGPTDPNLPEKDGYCEDHFGTTIPDRPRGSDSDLSDDRADSFEDIFGPFGNMDQMKFLQKIQHPKEFEGKAHQSRKEFLRQFEKFCGAAGQDPRDETNPPAK